MMQCKIIRGFKNIMSVCRAECSVWHYASSYGDIIVPKVINNPYKPYACKDMHETKVSWPKGFRL